MIINRKMDEWAIGPLWGLHPMAYDIQAAQYLYGANQPPNLGPQHTPLLHPSRVQSIYDTGGIDAIDLSSFTLRSVVDLTPGASSTFGYTHHIDDNTAIAFGTTIENVFSGMELMMCSETMRTMKFMQAQVMI